MNERRIERSQGFSKDRWLRVFLTSDPGFAEIAIGAFVVGFRGLMLLNMGFVYHEVGLLLRELHLTETVMGVLLAAVGASQVVAAGTCYYRSRALLAFAGSVLCFAVWLAYLGADKAHTALAWGWAGLTLAEAALAWRILMSRLALLDRLDGRELSRSA